MIRACASAAVVLLALGAGWAVSPSPSHHHRDGCIEVSVDQVIPPGGSRLVRIPLYLRIGTCPLSRLT